MPRKASSRNSARPGAPELTGIATPRLFTPPLRPLNRRTSKGYELTDFADMLGEPLMPWQRWAAIHALETTPDGRYRFRVVIILVARQNGKSSLGRTMTLWRMYLDGARTVLGVAQGLSLAREMWSLSLDTVRACPDLAAELSQVRNVNGDEWFKLASGSRYLIRASNRESGRGLSIDQLNIDELREWRNWQAWSALSKTTMARPDALILAMSNAGDDESVVLNQLRDAALSGRDPSIGIFEWSAEDGCELDDPAAWRQANPGLGHTIAASSIRGALAIDPPGVFRTEVLCQRVDHLDTAIDLPAWRDCADPTGSLASLRDNVAICLDLAPDSEHATLAAAALMPDGRVRVEIVKAWTSTNALRADWEDLKARIRPRLIGWYPAGPGAAVATLMRAEVPKWARTSTTAEHVEISGHHVAEACQELADLVRARAIVHNADPLLDAHIGGAQKLPAADGWRFTRKGTAHCDAAYAAAGAVRLVLTHPAPPKAAIRIVG